LQIGKTCLDFLVACIALKYQFGFLPSSFIGSVVKALPNSLELLSWHVVTLFLLSIDYVLQLKDLRVGQ